MPFAPHRMPSIPPDAKIAPPVWPWLWRFVQLQVGLFVFAVSVTLMLEAGIGLDPWSAVHEGLVFQTQLSFGRVVQGVGTLLIAFSWVVLRIRPGVGTVCNMLFIGAWIDLIRSGEWIPVWEAPDLLAYGQFLLGIVVNGFATALYIGAHLGAGPRDSFVLGSSARLGKSIRVTRVGIELTLLATAFLIGGTIGWGTLIFALLMGPVMQASLRLMRVSSGPKLTEATLRFE